MSNCSIHGKHDGHCTACCDAKIKRLQVENEQLRADVTTTEMVEAMRKLREERDQLAAAIAGALADLSEHVADGCAGANGNAREGACFECALAERLALAATDPQEVLCIGDGGDGDGCGYSGGKSGGHCPRCHGMLLSRAAIAEAEAFQAYYDKKDKE